jgi:protein subunit release factor B
MKYGVSTDKERALVERMRRLGIRDSDLIERFVKSSGPGGQNVNKLSTAVYLKHVPTGIEVKIQQERSQALNRFLARRIIADKVEAAVLERRTAEQERIARIRRQKRRRSRRAQEKVLAAKREVSAKKAGRQTPPSES